MRLIGITGKARAGKDTAAGFLVEAGWQRMAFADPVKDAAAAMFGVPRPDFDDDAIKERPHPYWGLSPRQMAQKVGTEGGRDVFGHDLWIRRAHVALETLAADMTDSFGPFEGVVFTDVRFNNEAEWIARRGGVIVRIERPGARPVAVHSSESGVNDFLIDFVIRNDRDIEHLRREILRAANPQEIA